MEMPSNFLEYRQSHPRCKFCEYFYKQHIPENFSYGYGFIPHCGLKDKSLRLAHDWYWNWAGCFCKYFSLNVDADTWDWILNNEI